MTRLDEPEHMLVKLSCGAHIAGVSGAFEHDPNA